MKYPTTDQLRTFLVDNGEDVLADMDSHELETDDFLKQLTTARHNNRLASEAFCRDVAAFVCLTLDRPSAHDNSISPTPSKAVVVQETITSIRWPWTPIIVTWALIVLDIIIHAVK